VPNPREAEQSFFASFFSKKEVLLSFFASQHRALPG
jgi:hypothetical protein